MFIFGFIITLSVLFIFLLYVSLSYELLLGHNSQCLNSKNKPFLFGKNFWFIQYLPTIALV